MVEVEKDLDNFIIILNDLRVIQARLILALRDEQEAIQTLSHELMERSLNQKNKCLTMLAAVDGNRAALFDRIGDKFFEKENIRPETLFELSELLSGDYKIKLRKILRSMRFLSKMVTELSQVNEIVIEESIKRVQGIRRHLTSLMGADTYNAAGRVINKI